LPNTYQTSPVIINPFDNDVVWNNTGKYWQVSFQTNLLGGFFIGTEKKPVSVADNENSSAANAVINIYPNPATDNIYISLPTNFLHKPVQLISVSGKIISGQIANTQTINFNIKNFASGVYLVRFADGEVKKVIVSKK
jgi:minor extracellular serine protease Vpr